MPEPQRTTQITTFYCLPANYSPGHCQITQGARSRRPNQEWSPKFRCRSDHQSPLANYMYLASLPARTSSFFHQYQLFKHVFTRTTTSTHFHLAFTPPQQLLFTLYYRGTWKPSSTPCPFKAVSCPVPLRHDRFSEDTLVSNILIHNTLNHRYDAKLLSTLRLEQGRFGYYILQLSNFLVQTQWFASLL